MVTHTIPKEKEVQNCRLCRESDEHGVLGYVWGVLVDVLAQVETVNSDKYINTLEHLKKRYRRVRPDRNVRDVLLLHDNATSHRSLKITKSIARLGFSVLPHPPYNPDLAPSDFYLFGPMKDAMQCENSGQ